MATIENYSESNFRYIDNFLKNKGLNEKARAGLIGNLYAESKLYPNNLQNSYEGKSPYYWTDDKYTKAVDNGTYKLFGTDRHGYGIYQLTSEGRKTGFLEYVRQKRKSISDIQCQCEYLWKELTTTKKFKTYVLPVLQEGRSVESCARMVMVKFEAPKNTSEENQLKRVGYAQAFYDKYYKNANNVQEDLPKVSDIKTDTITENGTTYVTYTVVAGDTLHKIAKLFNTTVEVLKILNPVLMKNPNLLGIGQVVKISIKSENSNDKATPSVISTMFKVDTATHYNKIYSKTYKTTCDLNLRTGAGVGKQKILTLNQGASVKCYGYYSICLGTKWFLVQVVINGLKYKGFCSSKYLK